MISLCDDLGQLCTTHKSHFVSFYNNVINNNKKCIAYYFMCILYCQLRARAYLYYA